MKTQDCVVFSIIEDGKTIELLEFDSRGYHGRVFELREYDVNNILLNRNELKITSVVLAELQLDDKSLYMKILNNRDKIADKNVWDTGNISFMR